MNNAKKKDEDEDEKSRKIYKRRKRDIIVCGNCTGTFMPNSTLILFDPRIQANR
jgi:hypothetical protein